MVAAYSPARPPKSWSTLCNHPLSANSRAIAPTGAVFGVAQIAPGKPIPPAMMDNERSAPLANVLTVREFCFSDARSSASWSLGRGRRPA